MGYQPTRNLNLILLVFLITALTSCSSSKKSTPDEQSATADSNAVSIDDSLVTAEKSLSPGTARVILETVTVEEYNAGDVRIWATIGQVMGYGPATPPIAPGQKVAIDATTYFKNSKQQPSYYSNRDSVICLIAHGNRMQMGNEEDGGYWRLMNILN